MLCGITCLVTRSTRLPIRSTHLSTLSTCITTRSTRLSIRRTRLSTRSICLSTRSTRRVLSVGIPKKRDPGPSEDLGPMTL